MRVDECRRSGDDPELDFDRVVCQFGLMFFADRTAGLAEMARVARSGGTVTIATWASIEQSPGYAAMIDLVQRVVGDDAARALAAPFALGTEERVTAVLRGVLPDASVTRCPGTARFESLEAWLHTDIRGWTLADMIDDQYATLRSAAATELAAFVGRDGRVRFPAPAKIATATIVGR